MNRNVENNSILVLCKDYPNNHGGRSMMYVHTRNLYYKKKGIRLQVLNFSTNEDYEIDDVSVISLESYRRNKQEYNCLVLHAANIRNHYNFLKKYGKKFKRYIFFYHGHEVLRVNKVYPEPFEYLKRSVIKEKLFDLYDSYKLSIWRKYIPTVVDKSDFVFVSNWMLNEFERWVGISRENLKNRYHVIYNSVGKIFENGKYDTDTEKLYDFITIRGNLDESKYCVDVVNELAKKTHKGRFLVVGKGVYFKHYKKADNIVWMDTSLSHEDITTILDKCRFALMPTKTDAQGVMMCEMAAYGIPVITSDIAVCHEVFADFKNAFYIENCVNYGLDKFLEKKTECIKHDRYFVNNTISKEVEIINRSFGEI